MAVCLGLDVHSKTTFVHAQDGGGATIFSGEIETTVDAFSALKERLAVPEGSEAALESGAMAEFVSGVLAGLGIKPVVVSAREVRQKARRVGQKSDSRDAFELCDGWRRGIFTCVVWVPPPQVSELRRLVAARQSFIGDRTSASNRMKALLRGEGMQKASIPRLSGEGAWARVMESLPEGSLRAIARRYFALWKAAAESAAEMTERIESLVAEEFSFEMDLLTEVPGVGVVVAAAFVAAVGEADRFADSAHVSSYLGLVPSTYDSGGSERHGRITKQGNPYARAMLCEAAQHASRANNPFNAYFAKLCATRGRKRALVAVAHRLARVMYRMLKTGERFDVKKLGVEFEPQKKVRKVYYRLKKNPAANAPSRC